MKIPSPRQGWRVFAGEVGVIVLGVLLALGAQQAVDAWLVRQNVAAFRETIDQELGHNLFVLQVRDRQVPCDLRQTAEAIAWLEQGRTGAAMPALHVKPPYRSYPYWSAWRSRDAETYRQLPPGVRRQYAMLYDLVENTQELNGIQREDWHVLRNFAEPGPLSLDDRRLARSAIDRLRRYVNIDRDNIAAFATLAEEAGIRPVFPTDHRREEIAAAMHCQSILTEPSQS